MAEKALHHRARGKDPAAASTHQATLLVDNDETARGKMPPYQAAGYGKVHSSPLLPLELLAELELRSQHGTKTLEG